MSHKFLQSIIKNRRVTIFTVVLLSILGAYNYIMMPKQENPQVTPPVAMVSVVYPGASPDEVEESVTIPVENEIAAIEGIDYIESFSRNSLSVVIVWLEMGTDVDDSWNILRRKMDDLQKDLPQTAQQIEIDTEMDRTSGFIFSFSGENYSNEQLLFYAKEAKRDIERIDGVSSVETKGEQKNQIKIIVDTAQLNQHSISLQEIHDVLSANHLQIPSGNLYDGSVSIPVQTSGKFRTAEEISELVIAVSPESGAILHIKDVADVVIEREENAARYLHNGEEAILLVGYFIENRNIVTIGDQVNETLDAITGTFPSDLVVSEVINQPSDIRVAVNQLMLNLFGAIAIVVFVVFLGMGLRNALVVAMAIPFSLLLSFSVMNLFGLQIHQISIAGFIISLGMLVDNAIVISDSIQVRVDQKEDRLSACINGVKDVAVPVFTATTTTVAAYVPLLILVGTAGEYIRSIPQIVIISLSSSYLAAIFFTPVIAYLFFKEKTHEAYGAKVVSAFKNLSNLGLAYKKVTIYLALALFVLALVVGSMLPLIFFPKADKNIIYLDLRSEQHANINATESLTQEAETILFEQKEIESVTSSVGEGLPRFFITLPGVTPSEERAQMMAVVDLEKSSRFKNNTELVQYLQPILDARISGGSVQVKELEQAEPSAAPIIVRVTGEDKELLREQSALVQEMLREINGTYNVTDDYEVMKYNYQVDIDNITAYQLGLTGYNIQNEINIALSGRIISDLQTESGQEYDIFLTSDIKNLNELQNFAIKSVITNEKVILKNVSETYPQTQQPLSKRYNRENNINVLSEVRLGYSAVAIQNILEEKIEEANLDPRITVAFSGEKENIDKYFGGLGVAAVFAFLAIYIIMMIQFSSTTQPFLVMISIPFSIIGASFGLFIFRQPISFTALLGLVSLIGVVINNAIILMTYINSEWERVNDVEEACRLAVEKRVRPILLTTATTVLGLIPLIFSGTLFVPMGVALMTGLLSSSLLTLVLIPVLYSIRYKKGGPVDATGDHSE